MLDQRRAMGGNDGNHDWRLDREGSPACAGILQTPPATLISTRRTDAGEPTLWPKPLDGSSGFFSFVVEVVRKSQGPTLRNFLRVGPPMPIAAEGERINHAQIHHTAAMLSVIATRIDMQLDCRKRA